MHIPLELQKYIFSYLNHMGDCTTKRKGRCICYTSQNKRCKNKVSYLQKLYCSRHDFDIPELFLHIQSIKK